MKVRGEDIVNGTIEESDLVPALVAKINNPPLAGHTHTLSQVTDAGDSAGLNVGTGAGTVAAGDHAHADLAPLASPTFTGTVTAPDIAANVANVFNVKRYGATGDGTTDDTAAIQAAVTAATHSVYFPAGTYRVTDEITLKNNLRLFGDSRETSIVKLTGIDPANAATNFSAFYLAANGSRVTIEQLGFKGENVAHAEQNAIESNAILFGTDTADVVVQDCLFEELYGFLVHCAAGGVRHTITRNTGLYCTGSINDNSPYSIITENNLLQCQGIEASGDYTRVDGNILRNVGVTGTVSVAAISLGGHTALPNTVGMTCLGNIVQVCTGFGISVNGVTDCLVEGNHIERTGNCGISVPGSPLASSRVRIVNNMVRSAGLSASTADYRIGILLSSSDCVVSGNTVLSGGDAGYDTYYGLVLYGDRCTVTGNAFTGSGKDVSLNGANDTVWFGNLYATARYEAISGSTFALMGTWRSALGVPGLAVANTFTESQTIQAATGTVSGVFAYGLETKTPAFVGYASRGTYASPTATQGGDLLLVIGGRGRGLDQWASGSRASVACVANQAWSNTAQGAYITLSTTANDTTTNTERVRINASGEVGIGKTAAAGTLLDVNGLVSGTGLIPTSAAPASQTAAGILHEMRNDGTYLYVCTTGGAAGAAHWKRVALDDSAW